MNRILPRCRGMLLATLAVPGIAGAATFTVNLPQDKPDANPGDGICSYDLFLDPTQYAVCTLRAAVMEGNATGQGAVEILLKPGVNYKLTIAGRNEDASKTGDLDILRPMKIGTMSDDSNRAVIDANALDRAFDFHPDAGQNTIHGVGSKMVSTRLLTGVVLRSGPKRFLSGSKTSTYTTADHSVTSPRSSNPVEDFFSATAEFITTADHRT